MVHTPIIVSFLRSHLFYNIVIYHQSNLRQWQHQPPSALSAPLSLPSSPTPPYWPVEVSPPSVHLASHCSEAFAGHQGDSHWRYTCLACKSDRSWCQSGRLHCPAPELFCNQRGLISLNLSLSEIGRKVISNKQADLLVKVCGWSTAHSARKRAASQVTKPVVPSDINATFSNKLTASPLGCRSNAASLFFR